MKHLCFSVPNETNRFQVPGVVRAVIGEKEVRHISIALVKEREVVCPQGEL